jgi:class 3 adenylate cyclase
VVLLAQGRKVEPEHHESVTVFFSDIVGYTSMVATMSPVQTADLLSRLYSLIDEVAGAHDVFKVETIGDAYMAVTNLVEPQPDHAARIACFAKAVFDALEQRPVLVLASDPSLGAVQLRVGLHSGPVRASPRESGRRVSDVQPSALRD